MSVVNPYNQYLENQIMTATPGKLLVMTFDAGIRFGRIALERMKEHNLYEQSTNIGKMQNILLELMGSLNHSIDPALAANLEALYTYMFDKLTHANVKDDTAALEEVIGMMTELRSTWAEAEILSRTGGSAVLAGSGVAA